MIELKQMGYDHTQATWHLDTQVSRESIDLERQNAKNNFVAVEKQAESELIQDGTFAKFAALAKKKDRHLAFCKMIIDEYWPIAVDKDDPPEHLPKDKEWLEFDEEFYKKSN